MAEHKSPAAIAEDLGERLKQARLNANLTQADVAERWIKTRDKKDSWEARSSDLACTMRQLLMPKQPLALMQQAKAAINI